MEVLTSGVLETKAAKEDHCIYSIEKPETKSRKPYLILKRIFDLSFSFGGLIILSVPMMIIALVIIIDSPGSPIYIQERLGKNGKPFRMYKFRSMRLDAEDNGPKWADLKDERCTKVGYVLRKSHLDELPQLFNILKNDMSFVGPRPERACFYDKFETYIKGFSNRLEVTPGLTGYAQVNGGYDLTPEEKILYDMEYIERQSAWLDIECIAKTVGLVFTGKGAH